MSRKMSHGTSRAPVRRSIADKSLTAAACFCAIALGAANAGPSISPSVSPHVNSLGGGFNNQVDFYGGRGGSVQPGNLSDCPRRVIDRLPKDSASAAKARRRCGGADR
jgi:hypothetical protein